MRLLKELSKKTILFPFEEIFMSSRIQRQPLVDSFEIATVIYGPSYISFESALSYHGWIPEAVRTTTCASVKRAKEFETPIGVFFFLHIPIEALPF
mgnify:CR=1 FL=1